MASVWYIVKPGEERRYATPTLPSLEWTRALYAQGYEVLRIDFELPAYLDPAAYIDAAKVERVASDEGESDQPGPREALIDALRMKPKSHIKDLAMAVYGDTTSSYVNRVRANLSALGKQRRVKNIGFGLWEVVKRAPLPDVELDNGVPCTTAERQAVDDSVEDLFGPNRTRPRGCTCDDVLDPGCPLHLR